MLYTLHYRLLLCTAGKVVKWKYSWSLLESLFSCHSKTPKEFAHLELGTLKLGHILTQNRLLYHHHIITQNENETIRKIYEKQKTTLTKGDWFQLLKEDFQFIEQELDDEKI